MTLKLLALFTVLTVSAQASGPALTSNPAQIQFNAGIGQPSPAAINVAVTASPAGPTISAATDQPWLSAAPSSSKFAISVNTAGLAPGTYTGNVSFSAPGYSGAVTKVILSIANPSNGLVPAPGSPYAVNARGPVFAADFNMDGKLDIAVLDTATGAVTVLLGNGIGGFTAAAGLAAQGAFNTFAMVVGDFNNDGKPDLAFSSSLSPPGATMTLFLGNGAGGFTPSPAGSLANGGGVLAVGDFNLDGNLDLLTSTTGLAIWLGDGHGHFTQAPGSPLAVGGANPMIADFNGDGIPDFIAPKGQNGFTVFLGDGTGRFTSQSFSAMNFGPGLVVGDFNGDGKSDVAVFNQSFGGSQVFLGDGAGGFTAGNSLSVKAGGGLAGDFNGDGKLDILSRVLLLGDGVGNFANSASQIGNEFWEVAADFNGDGRLDLAYGDDAGEVVVLLGAPTNTQVASTVTLSLPAGILTIAAGQPVDATATVTSAGVISPTGSVQFRDGSTVLGIVTLSASNLGNAVFHSTGLAVGQHSLYADYLGDNATAPSTSAALVVNAVPPAPQYHLSLSHNGGFTEGQMGAQYSIAVTNIGTAPTSGTITVTDSLPNGITLVSMAGQGWTCSGNTCTRSDVLDPGMNIGQITVTVNVTGNPSQLINTATVSGGGAPSVTATDATTIGIGSNLFGWFDTPVDLSTGISGALNVTGWALSSAGVANVTLWRDPVGSEPVASFGLVFLANATITPGARPDVAKAFPGYPDNNSGWGTQVLTNLFPNSGNGTFRIHAVVTDNNKNVIDLGAKTITVDNAHAALPFGTLDTPAQDATVSGTAYTSFGWALTPNPANIIPTDGSTIVVYIDSGPVGHPVYNNNRQDIATLFPGLQNSNGAVGYFMIDSTKLANGLHTIAWVVTDSAGNAQGIGNRFFNVQN